MLGKLSTEYRAIKREAVRNDLPIWVVLAHAIFVLLLVWGLIALVWITRNI